MLLVLWETKHFLGKYERGGRAEEKRDAGVYQKSSVQCQSRRLHHFGKKWSSILSLSDEFSNQTRVFDFFIDTGFE